MKLFYLITLIATFLISHNTSCNDKFTLLAKGTTFVITATPFAAVAYRLFKDAQNNIRNHKVSFEPLIINGKIRGRKLAFGEFARVTFLLSEIVTAGVICLTGIAVGTISAIYVTKK
jgi:hypothetical protein